MVKNCKKLSGYGTAMVSSRPDIMHLEAYNNDEEIVLCNFDSHGVRGLVITGYRSPSSKNEEDIRSFYMAVNSIIVDTEKRAELDFIIFVGDDNASHSSSCYYSRMAAKYMETFVTSRHQMVDLIPDMCTRKDKQPDS